MGEFALHSANLEHNSAPLDDRYPMIRCSFSFAHSGFRRFGRNRFVREYTYPDVAATPQMVGNRPPRGLDLAGINPCRLKGNKPYVAEADLATTGCLAATAPTMHLSVFDAFGHQHF
jgi:hypothetical protein